jgi:hypothetical protein
MCSDRRIRKKPEQMSTVISIVWDILRESVAQNGVIAHNRGPYLILSFYKVEKLNHFLKEISFKNLHNKLTYGQKNEKYSKLFSPNLKEFDSFINWRFHGRVFFDQVRVSSDKFA